MLSPDGLDADGFKIDFTARTPSGSSLRHRDARWGAALLHEQLRLVYAAANGAVVLRGYETCGRAAEVTVELPFLDRRIEPAFLPGEIKTLLVPASAEVAAIEVDLLEWDPAKPPPGVVH
jgi:hypothetical protein